jgi:ComEC/Rec2-related protein
VASALALAAIVILAWSPAQLFEAGFLCSFVVVIGLVLLCPVLERPLRRLYEPDPFRLQPEARGVVLLRRLGRQAGMLLALNVAAWLASTPLTALYFGRFTPISLLSNFIVIPVSSVVILTGCLSMLLGPCLAWFADVFNHANLFLIVVMVKGTEALMKIPGGSTLIGPLPPWPAAAWYAALAAWLLWRRGKMVDTSRAE